MRMNAKTLSVASILMISACVSGDGRGAPLYPVTGVRPKRDAVAELQGYVSQVDNRPATEGRWLELLPGCHIIVTPAAWADVDPMSGAVVADTGSQTFALLMRAGCTYRV